MKQIFLPLSASLLIVSLAGCALIPDLPPPATPTPSFPLNDYNPSRVMRSCSATRCSWTCKTARSCSGRACPCR